MAPRRESAKESTWFRGLSTAAAKGKDAHGCVHPEKSGNVPEEPRQWCGFEFAELLEEGLGPGPTLSFTKPPRDPTEQQRLVVRRSQNREEYQLTTDTGRHLLVARCNTDGRQYDIYVAHDSQPPRPLGPAFRLTSDASRNLWSLHSIRCERCESRGRRQCGSREVACMTHYFEAVGEGQACCMDLRLPELNEEGDSEVVCPVCGDSPTGRVLELSTRRPKWNAKHKSLALDFAGRCSMASAKNFQLEAPDKLGKVKLLFGKVADNQFVLDYRYPLGAVQAFAAALSASHWK